MAGESPQEPDDGLALQRRVAGNVRRLRERRRLTQEQVAAAAAMAPRHIQKIEAAEVNITLRTAARLARALAADAYELFIQIRES